MCIGGGEKRSFNYLTCVSEITVKRLSIDGLSTQVNYKKFSIQFVHQSIIKFKNGKRIPTE